MPRKYFLTFTYFANDNTEKWPIKMVISNNNN